VPSESIFFVGREDLAKLFLFQEALPDIPDQTHFGSTGEGSPDHPDERDVLNDQNTGDQEDGQNAEECAVAANLRQHASEVG
jgi:hypothetical protein